MEAKYLKKISYFFSFLFLVVLTILLIFFFIISIKPIKINFLDYFDRESEVFQKIDIREIGDVYLSFNKVSKNFELLIEDLVIGNSYFPSTLVGFDMSLRNKTVNSSIKIFDADFSLKAIKPSFEEKTNFPSVYQSLVKKYAILKNFSIIEIVNSKLTLVSNNNKNIKFLIDLKLTHEKISGYVSDYLKPENFFTFNFSNNLPAVDLDVEFSNFNIDFVKFFFDTEIFSFRNANISGRSEISGSGFDSLNKIFFDLILNGDFSYESKFGKKKINLADTILSGYLKNQELIISFDFSFNNSIFSLGTGIDLSKSSKPKFFMSINEISVDNLLSIWPKDFKDTVFDWMNVNSKGLINNFLLTTKFTFEDNRFSLGKLDGKFDYHNVQIIYMKSMPAIKMIEGRAEIVGDKITFFIKNGISEDLEIIKGNVELFDLSTTSEKATVDLNIVSKNKKIVDYLDQSPMNKKNFSKLRKINGEVDLTLNLTFPLLLDLKVDEINYYSEAKISNATLENLYKDFSISDMDIFLKVDPEIITYNGKGNLQDSLVNFQGKQFVENYNIIDKIEGNYLLSGEFIDSFIPNPLDDFSGKIDLNFSYFTGENSDFKIEAIGDLTEFRAESSFLGANLNFENGKIRFLITPYNEAYSSFLDINTPNLNIEINSVFNEKKIIIADLTKFITPIQNFKAKVENSDKLDLYLSGERLTLEKLDLKGDNQISEFHDINIELDVNELFLGKRKFNSPKINLEKKDMKFERLLVNLTGEKDYHKIYITKEEGAKTFFLESNYVPGLFDLLDINFEVNTGSLKVEGKQDESSGKFNGQIAGKDFVFLDTPFLADFITLFSLQGLAQKLKDGGIFFEELNGGYEFFDGELKIIDSLLKGSELGVFFNSNISFIDDDFVTNGTIIPAYTINTLLTKFPIVGEIITAGSPEEGLIGANFDIEKVDGEYKVTYNPISVFVPNLIKNFLGD